MLPALDGYIHAIMDPYQALLTQLDDAYNAVPPNLPPMPSIGTDLSGFDYSNITISGDDWSYDQ